MIIDEKDYLMHYGVLRKSGRYPWGSGEGSGTPRGRSQKFLDIVKDLERQGLKPTEIVQGLGLESTTQLRSLKSIAKNEVKQGNITQAEALKKKGLSTTEIGRRMGAPESTVRTWLAPGAKDRSDVLSTTANMLKEQVAEKRFIDIGKGNEHHIGVSDTMLRNAVARLKEEGYQVHTVPVQQLATGKFTNVKVLAPPGTSWSDVNRGQKDIKLVTKFSEDGGRTMLGIHPPLTIDPKRVAVKYNSDDDGVLYVRPGVPDVELGGSSYAQVRMSVGDGHYLKGMAIYKHDLPDGVDVEFHTNKDNTGNKLDAMKKVNRRPDGSVDMDNPYGANIKRQIVVKDKDGNERVTSAMNIVNAEGDWSKWSRSLSSQMLSKQNPSLAKRQLDITYKKNLDEFKRLSELTNPAVRKKMLEDLGDSIDSTASHLDAAAIPRTHGHHVILPIASMPPTHVYAPNYKDGERVVLIRHPHGGTFEIPELVVDNHHPGAKKLIGPNAIDAVGIHPSVAQRLSGADFDGDTVLVIPNNHSGGIKTSPPLEGLKNFDPIREYPKYPGMKVMSKSAKGHQMGDISNLITDMTIKGATRSELARAIRHSMVVIDAEKHELNWKESAIRNGIPDLKQKYQGSKRAGAQTLISRAGAKVKIPDQRPRRVSEGGPIDKNTGKRYYTPTGNPKTIEVRRLAITEDAHTLTSGPPGIRIERIYADHANALKALANEARKESVNTPRPTYSKSAAKVYKDQVSSLTAKLKLAERNAPLERQAQIIAGATYKQKLAEYPDMDKETKKKIKFQALNEARTRIGAGKDKLEITDKEWEAIQAGAISPSKLSKILDEADMEKVRELATPRAKRLLTDSKARQAQALLDKGFTRAEVAERFGVSLSTLDKVTSNLVG